MSGEGGEISLASPPPPRPVSNSRLPGWEQPLLEPGVGPPILGSPPGAEGDGAGLGPGTSSGGCVGLKPPQRGVKPRGARPRKVTHVRSNAEEPRGRSGRILAGRRLGTVVPRHVRGRGVASVRSEPLLTSSQVCWDRKLRLFESRSRFSAHPGNGKSEVLIQPHSSLSPAKGEKRAEVSSGRTKPRFARESRYRLYFPNVFGRAAPSAARCQRETIGFTGEKMDNDINMFSSVTAPPLPCWEVTAHGALKSEALNEYLSE